jgi:hypothetical protein
LGHEIGPKAEKRAKKDLASLIGLLSLDPRCRKGRLTEAALEVWKGFILDHLEGLRPSRLIHKLTIGKTVTLRNVPYFIRTVPIRKLFQMFMQWCESREIDSKLKIGQNTFAQLTQAISKKSKRESNVSYFFTQFCSCILLLSQLLQRLAYIFEKSMKDPSDDDDCSDDEVIVVNAPDESPEDLSDHEITVLDACDEDDLAETNPEVVDVPNSSHGDNNDIEEEENDDDDESGNPNDEEAIAFEDSEYGGTAEQLLGEIKRLGEELPIAAHNIKHHVSAKMSFGSCDGEAGHCAKYALGACYLDDGLTIKPHVVTCQTCQSAFGFGNTMHELVQCAVTMILRRNGDSGDYVINGNLGIELRSMVPVARRVAKEFRAYYAHRVRGGYQAFQIRRHQQCMKEGTAFVLVDYKMKILQTYFREDQKHFFGKQGNSLLGALVYIKRDGKLLSFFLDLALKDNMQDAYGVQCCLTQIAKVIRARYPTITSFAVQSDNAANFNSRSHLEFVYQMNKLNWNCSIRMTRWIFTEPQCGKSSLDAHFSYLMIAIFNYVDAGNDVVTPLHIFQALKSNPIRNTSTLLLELERASSGSKAKLKAFPVGGSRSMCDIMFTEGSEIWTYEQSEINRTVINMESTAVKRWRQSYVQAGIDFTLPLRTKICEQDTHNEHLDATQVGEAVLTLPEATLTISQKATERDRLIGNFIHAFTSSEAEKFERHIEEMTESMLEEEPSFEAASGWATRQKTTIKTLQMPFYVVDQLNILVRHNINLRTTN